MEKSHNLGLDTWKKYTRKVPTEDCLMLNAREVFASDRPPPPDQGVLRWMRFVNGRELEAAPAQPFTLRELDGALVLTLQLWYGAGEQTIHTCWERHQIWFVCGECGRLVRKLYCPPGEVVLSCRRCWDLTDYSVQRRSWGLFDPPKWTVTPRLESCQE